MFYTLKRDPEWLLLPLNSVFGTVSLLSEDGEKVSVPTAVLLASPLLRSLVSDLHPAALHPLFLSLAVTAEVLLAVGQIMNKGEVKVKNDRLRKKMQLVFKMIGLEPILDYGEIEQNSLEPVSAKDISEETVDETECDDKSKLEIEVKLEYFEDYGTVVKDENVASDILISEGYTIGECHVKETVGGSDFDTERKTKQSVKYNLRDIDISRRNKNSGTKKEKKNISTVKHLKESQKNQTPLKCDYCDYQASAQKTLRRHSRKHTGERPFKCDYCDYQAARNETVVRHVISMHEVGEKPHSCNYCDFKSARKDSVAQHIRYMHHQSGEKPHSCKYCDFKAARKDNVAQHIRYMHQPGEKPYACNLCDYKSNHRSGISVHSRKHAGPGEQELLKCEMCEFKTAERGHMNKHKRRVHGGK